MPEMDVVVNTEVAEVTLLSVPDQPGVAAEVFGTLSAQGFNVEMVNSAPQSKGKANISFAIQKSELNAVLAIIEPLKRKMGATEINYNTDIALVSLSGHQLSQIPGIASRMFGALSKAGINIRTVTTSLHSITCVISSQHASQARQVLEEEYKSP